MMPLGSDDVTRYHVDRMPRSYSVEVPALQVVEVYRFRSNTVVAGTPWNGLDKAVGADCDEMCGDTFRNVEPLNEGFGPNMCGC